MMLQGGVLQKTVTIRLPESEFSLLTRAAASAQRTKSDLLREFIRTLEQPPTREPKQKKAKSAART